MRLVLAIPDKKYFSDDCSAKAPALLGGEPATVTISYSKTRKRTKFSTVSDYATIMRRPCILFTIKADGCLDAVVSRNFGDTVHMDVMKRLTKAPRLPAFDVAI